MLELQRCAARYADDNVCRCPCIGIALETNIMEDYTHNSPDPFYTPRGPFVDDPRGMGRSDSERIPEGSRKVGTLMITRSSRAKVGFHLAFGAWCLEAYVQPGLQVNLGGKATDAPPHSNSGPVL